MYCFLVGFYLPWVVFTNSCSFAKFGCGLLWDIEVAQVHDAFAVDEIGKGANILSFLRRHTIGQSNSNRVQPQTVELHMIVIFVHFSCFFYFDQIRVCVNTCSWTTNEFCHSIGICIYAEFILRIFLPGLNDSHQGKTVEKMRHKGHPGLFGHSGHRLLFGL